MGEETSTLRPIGSEQMDNRLRRGREKRIRPEHLACEACEEPPRKTEETGIRRDQSRIFRIWVRPKVRGSKGMEGRL